MLTGGITSPGTDSEWNELLYRVHIETKNFQSNWDTYDNVELNIGSHNGLACWVQETYFSDRAIVRGRNGLQLWTLYRIDNGNCLTGWRPVLELVQ